MSEVEHVVNEAAPPITVPLETSVSTDPIEGGVAVFNGAIPPGEDGHLVYRTLSVAEKEARSEADTLSVGWSRKRALAFLRIERNKLLASSDWTQVADARSAVDSSKPMSDAERAEWVAYRQQLRDLPATTADPDEPVWPKPPASLETDA